MEAELLFLPGQIARTGRDLTRDAARLSALSQEVRDLSPALAAAWQGEAAQRCLALLADAAGRTQALSQQLETLGGQLAAASGIYEQGERKAGEVQEGLPVDGIFQI